MLPHSIISHVLKENNKKVKRTVTLNVSIDKIANGKESYYVCLFYILFRTRIYQKWSTSINWWKGNTLGVRNSDSWMNCHKIVVYLAGMHKPNLVSVIVVNGDVRDWIAITKSLFPYHNPITYECGLV